MKSEQHKPILKPSWFNLPPKDPQERNESSICIENIGTKEAHVLDVRIEFSYVDEPIIIPPGQKRIVDPGVIPDIGIIADQNLPFYFYSQYRYVC